MAFFVILDFILTGRDMNPLSFFAKFLFSQDLMFMNFRGVSKEYFSFVYFY